MELDVFENIEGNDPVSDHISVMVDGDSADAKKTGIPAFSLVDDERTIWVDYAAKSKRLKVFASQTNNKPANPLITYRKKLAGLFDGKSVRAGFTGATGGDFAVQDVLSWKLKQRR